jgi:membrane protein YqaA with SNARE-associated domain
VEYLLVAAVVFAINLLPAFGPPTWAILVFFSLQSDLPAVPLILIGAVAAAAGRFVLALMSRRSRGLMKQERLDNLEAARKVLAGGGKRTAIGLALFAISPIPSAQLFVAAGLLAFPLVPLTLAFFVGRLVSYSIYVGVASAAKHSLGSIFQSAFRSPWGIALQIVMLAGLVALFRVDWAGIIARRAGHRKQSQAAGGDTSS